MIDPKNIQLTENELNKCLEFSEISAQNQQKIEFGQKTTSPRKVSEIARDNLIGKIAEVAFCKLLKENYGIDIELDFNYYPRGQWDSQDAEVNGWRIDIKGTRKGGHWLLIEWNKLNFRQRDNNLSHVFVMFSVDWNRNIDAPTGKASFEGIASLNKLNRYTPNTRVLLKGSCIPGTHARLQADNYGIHFDNLFKDLDTFILWLQSPPPASVTEHFANPYTGEVIAHADESISDENKKADVPDIPNNNTETSEEKTSFISKIKYKLMTFFNSII